MASCHTHAACYGIFSHRIRRIHRTSYRDVLPRISQNSQNLAAWVWQGCHTLLICEHLCSSVGGSSLPKGSVCSVRSAGISFLPRMARMDTDCYGALFSHRIHRIHRIWQRGYGRDAIPSYICAHPCSSVGGSSLPEVSVCSVLICGRLFSARSFCAFRAFCGNLFPPTDFTDLHRCLGCAVLPRNSQNSQNLAAWVWQGCHTLLHLCVPCVLWEYLFSHGFHRATQMLRARFVPTDFTDLHRCLGCALFPRNSQNPQNLAAWVWQECHTLLICAHLCHLWEALLCKGGCAFRAFCGNIFSPTDFTELHRCLGHALFPRISQIYTDA